MAWLDGNDVDLRDLELGHELGLGGQGKVHDLRGAGAGHVFKEYIVSGVNGSALKRLVGVVSESSSTSCSSRRRCGAISRRLTRRGGSKSPAGPSPCSGCCMARGLLWGTCP